MLEKNDRGTDGWFKLNINIALMLFIGTLLLCLVGTQTLATIQRIKGDGETGSHLRVSTNHAKSIKKAAVDEAARDLLIIEKIKVIKNAESTKNLDALKQSALLESQLKSMAGDQGDATLNELMKISEYGESAIKRQRIGDVMRTVSVNTFIAWFYFFFLCLFLGLVRSISKSVWVYKGDRASCKNSKGVEYHGYGLLGKLVVTYTMGMFITGVVISGMNIYEMASIASVTESDYSYYVEKIAGTDIDSLVAGKITIISEAQGSDNAVVLNQAKIAENELAEISNALVYLGVNQEVDAPKGLIGVVEDRLFDMAEWISGKLFIGFVVMIAISIFYLIAITVKEHKKKKKAARV